MSGSSCLARSMVSNQAGRFFAAVIGASDSRKGYAMFACADRLQKSIGQQSTSTRAYVNFVFLCFILVGLSGCASLPLTFAPIEPPLNLLDPSQLFESSQFQSIESVSAEHLPEVQVPAILATTEEMLAYIPSRVHQQRTAKRKVEALIEVLRDGGFYDGTYDSALTYTAQQTFEQKQGNCLAFTSLFIALARELDLDARFQRIRGVMTYDARNGLLENQQHINVIIRNRPSSQSSETIVVDFNYLQPSNQISHTITDQAATALYLNNYAIEHLIREEFLQAFINLKAALELDPENSDLWVNLGTLYLRLDAISHAMLANQYALQLDRRNGSALVGLQIVYARQGLTEKAKSLRTELAKLQRQNPYFHFALAQKSFQKARYRDTLKHLSVATRLAIKDPRVFELKAETYLQLQDHEKALSNFQRAANISTHDEIQAQYLRRAEALRATLAGKLSR